MRVSKKKLSKYAFCSNALLIISLMVPYVSNYCYTFWHHAPMLPDCMRE